MDATPPMHMSSHAYAPTEEVFTISADCLGSKYAFKNDGSIAIIEVRRKNEEKERIIDISSSNFIKEYREQSLFGRFALACLPDGSFGYTFLGYKPSGKGTSVQVKGNFKVDPNLNVSSTGISELPNVDLQGFDRKRSDTIKFRR
jgi:hypothetical protein